MPDIDGSLIRHAALAACLILLIAIAAPAAAQMPQPIQVPPPPAPEFLPRYDFHMSIYRLVHDLPPTEQRFSWDSHFGGTFDLVDYVHGRGSVTIDYEAVMGRELRPFDPNQGNYTLEAVMSGRAAGLELVGGFHHVSRHLSDRPKTGSVAWNEIIGRVLKRVAIDRTTIDLDFDGGRAVQHSFVDYTWIGELNVLVRHPVTPTAGLFAHASGQLFGVDGTIANRRRQSGGLLEAGVRLNGKGGSVEVFAGFERRVDAYPLDRVSQHWGLVGFRLLSR
jgi:hypothetical protein